MSKTVRIIALILVALMLLSLIPAVAFGVGENYTINVSSTTGGRAEASPASANKDAPVTITATPDSGYHFVRWSCPGRGIDGTTTNPFTFSMGASDLDVKAIFEADSPAEYNITVTPDGNGTATADVDKAAAGATITITATAETGYHFDHWSCPGRGIDGTTANPFTFSMGASDLEVTAVFVPTEYNINVTSGGNGTATANPSTAAAGTEITLSATPESGYEFVGWLSSDVEISGNSFQMPAKNVTVRAVFRERTTPVSHKIELIYDSAKGHASVKETATRGENVILNAKANNGYVFAGWTSDFGFTSADALDVFEMPDKDVKLYAAFETAPSPIKHDLEHHAFKAPTATVDGQREYWSCKLHSGEYFWDRYATEPFTDFSKVIIPHGHAHDTTHLIFVGYEPATCTEAGHSAHYFCPICKWTFDLSLNLFDPYLEPVGHKWSHWKVVKRPTPTEPGLEKCTCYHCGKEKYFTIYYNENPKTGDESNMALWISLMTLAAVGTAGAMLYMRRKKENG